MKVRIEKGSVQGPAFPTEVCRELEAAGEAWTGLGQAGAVGGPGSAIGMTGVAVEVEASEKVIVLIGPEATLATSALVSRVLI